MLVLREVRWCAEECQRQRSGELSVYDMCQALEEAKIDFSANRAITPQIIKDLGFLVDQEKNSKGWRTAPVHFANMEVRRNQSTIEHEINRLCEFQQEMTSQEFYQKFEEIHPFEDGNGRVGAILYNWHKGTLLTSLDVPPAFKLKTY